ncbi:hypothetical protein ACROYT_G014573 [Oculina patagonica]
MKKRNDERQWDEMTNDDYNEAGTYFDLMAMANLNPVTVNDDRQDKAYKKRVKELRELIKKKNNFPPVARAEEKPGGVCSALNPAAALGEDDDPSASLLGGKPEELRLLNYGCGRSAMAIRQRV